MIFQDGALQNPKTLISGILPNPSIVAAATASCPETQWAESPDARAVGGPGRPWRQQHPKVAIALMADPSSTKLAAAAVAWYCCHLLWKQREETKKQDLNCNLWRLSFFSSSSFLTYKHQ